MPERMLFGGEETPIWAGGPQFIRFEKGDVKVQVKIIEFDYGTQEDYVFLEIGTNGPECPDVHRGIFVLKLNELTKTVIKHMKMERRDLERILTPHRSPDTLLHSLLRTLQTFTPYR